MKSTTGGRGWGCQDKSEWAVADTDLLLCQSQGCCFCTAPSLPAAAAATPAADVGAGARLVLVLVLVLVLSLVLINHCGIQLQQRHVFTLGAFGKHKPWTFAGMPKPRVPNFVHSRLSEAQQRAPRQFVAAKYTAQGAYNRPESCDILDVRPIIYVCLFVATLVQLLVGQQLGLVPLLLLLQQPPQHTCAAACLPSLATITT